MACSLNSVLRRAAAVGTEQRQALPAPLSPLPSCVVGTIGACSSTVGTQECQGHHQWGRSLRLPLPSLTASRRYRVLSWWFLRESRGPPSDHQSSHQASYPKQLEHWGRVKEIQAGTPSCSPSLHLCSPLPRGHRDGGKS